MARLRITVRGEGVELRGFIDADDPRKIAAFAQAMEPFGLVFASQADEDYNPFTD